MASDNPAIAQHLQHIQRGLAHLAELAPGEHAWGPPWTPEQLEAFETKYSCVLPAGYRGFLAAVGDGGPGPGRGILPLRKQPVDELALLARTFPLTRGWVTPTIADELRAEGLFGEYEEYLYPLEPGVSPDHGSLAFGVTSDHRIHLLVVTGDRADEVWIDNRGNDFEEVLPTKQTFLGLFTQWLDDEVAERVARHEFDRLVATGDLRQLRAAYDDEELGERFKVIIRRHLLPDNTDPLSPELAKLMVAYYDDDYGRVGQLLVLGNLWEELEAHSRAWLEKLDNGELASSPRAEPTLRTHLAVAQVALGRPGPIDAHAGMGYYHRSSALVPLVLSRWSNIKDLQAVFARLREDIAVEFLAAFPPARLILHLELVVTVGERISAYLAGGGKFSGSAVSEIAGRLLEGGTSEEVRGPALVAAMQHWLWLAGCTTSEKGFEAHLEVARPLFDPEFTSREQAKARLVELGGPQSPKSAPSFLKLPSRK